MDISLDNKNLLKVLFALMMASVFFWVCIYILVPDKSTRVVSLITSTISGAIALTMLCIYFFRIGFISIKGVYFVLGAFLVRIAFGTFHYLLSIDSNYFNGQSQFMYLWDFEWLYRSMIYVSNYWNDNGFFWLSPNFLETNKNAFLTAYMSLIFYFGNNDHSLNIVVLNSFHNIMVALLVAGVAYTLKGKTVARIVLTISLLQPYGLATDIYWRDSVGQFFVIASIVLLLDVKSNYRGFLFFLMSSFFAFMQRTVYIVNSLIIYLIYNVWVLIWKKNKFFSLLVLIVSAAGLIYLGNLLFEISKLQQYLLPIGGGFDTAISRGGSGFIFIIGLIGPFPWHQIFNPAITGAEYLFYDMLQASFCMVIYFLFAQQTISKKKHAYSAEEKLIMLSVILYMIFSLFSYGYISYTTIAVVLLLVVIENLNILSFLTKWVISIFAYVILSFIWFLLKGR